MVYGSYVYAPRSHTCNQYTSVYLLKKSQNRTLNSTKCWLGKLYVHSRLDKTMTALERRGTVYVFTQQAAVQDDHSLAS